MEGRIAVQSDVRLRAVLADAEFVGANDIGVVRCTTDAASCVEGDLFVAVSDEQSDGHTSVAQAVRLGASAVVASRPILAGVPVCYVPDTRQAYGRICQALAGDPSLKLRTIGVAGSFGKTTAGYLIASVLNAAGRTTGVLSSLGYSDGVELADARWTTPPPPVTAAWLARMAANGCSHAVVEVSSRGLAESRTAGVRFDACCITNLQRSVSRGNRTYDSRPAAARWLDQLTPEGVLVANVDDAGAAELAAAHDGPVVTVGLNSPAELTAVLLESHCSEQTFLLSFGREVIPVRSTLLGAHNVGHCLLAAAVGTLYGVRPDAIVRGLESVKELPGRLERIECGQPFGVFLDEARTPQALEMCLETLRLTTTGRLRCIYSPIAADVRTRVEYESVVRRWCDEAIVAEPGRNGGDRAETIRRALGDAESGDCLLIVVGETAEHATSETDDDGDDRQLVRQTLYQLAHETERRTVA
jgi:UDP-N-acetylmuramoyl-L-alanyl-D-glutamate--2,6-diaminopimelate ligase